MLTDKLHTYQGKAFSKESLKFLDENFAKSYDRSVKKNGPLPFLKVYRKSQILRDVTFSEFACDVEKIRRFLLHEHADKEVIVTVDGNSYEHLIYMTATMLAGFIISPMNPNEGPERLQAKIRQIKRAHAYFATPSLDVKAYPDIASRPRRVEDTLVLIFTSGTTGYSKIVQQTEQGILSNVDALIECHDLRERKVIATPLPVFHVNSLEFAFCCSLLSGQRMILYEGFDFFSVLDSLEKDQVRIFSVVPHILKSLTDLANKVLEKNLVLDYCVTAASSLSPDLARKLVQTFPFKIIQGYGLSEAVNFSLTNPPTLAKEKIDFWLTSFQRPSVGTPLRGNEAVVLSEEGQSLGPSQEGEICLRGHNVMLGYKDQDNSEVFAGDYLHTGDLGFYQLCAETGLAFFFITGRKKDVMKRFGLTVSLVEVDDWLLQWCPPRVTAIAVPFENISAGEEIGVVVSGPLTTAELESLREFMETKMPAPLRPRVLIKTERKLRTDSGKPQRWAQKDLFQKYQKTSFADKILVEEAPS